jgi:hypothetical protein
MVKDNQPYTQEDLAQESNTNFEPYSNKEYVYSQS